MRRSPFDEVVVNGRSYVYRDKFWMTPTGYRVSTSDGQKLTFAFYEKHGRVPGSPPPPRRGARNVQPSTGR